MDNVKSAYNTSSLWSPHYEKFWFPTPIGLAPFLVHEKHARGTEFLLNRVRITFPIAHICLIGIFLQDGSHSNHIDSNGLANLIVYDSPNLDIVLTNGIRVGIYLIFAVPPTSVEVTLYGLMRRKKLM